MKTSQQIHQIKNRLQKAGHKVLGIDGAQERRTKNIHQRFSEGSYFRIIVRPRSEFVSVKSENPTGLNTIQQINGQSADGLWSTQSWLIHKDGAHIDSGSLIPDTKAVKRLLQVLGSSLTHVEGNIFKLSD